MTVIVTRAYVFSKSWIYEYDAIAHLTPYLIIMTTADEKNFRMSAGEYYLPSKIVDFSFRN